MLNVNAVFSYKESTFRPKDCVVEKVIRLSGTEYDHFARNLQRDWDFIRDNPIDTVVDPEGRYHCLLVVSEGRRDGILVNSEGGAYARYSAFIPNAEDFLSVGQYPALAVLNRRLTDIVEFIVEESGSVQSDGRAVIDLQEIDTMYGIDLIRDNVLHGTVLKMLESRPEINDWELDKNELILYRASDTDPSADDLSDPTVTKTDMYAYGYGWDGMIPLSDERAVSLHFQEYQIYLLHADGTESAVDGLDDIESFRGMLGVKDPIWAQETEPQSIEVFILNRERYENGEVLGEWLALPADAEVLRGLFERISIDRPSEGAFSITAVRMPLPDLLREHVTKYDSLDELNMLASFIAGMEDFELDKVRAILTSGVKDIGTGTTAIINALCDENFDAFRMIDAADYKALGRYWENEVHDKPEDVSFEEYGRQIVEDEKGKFTEWGYIYFRYDELLPEYTGSIPDEYRIVDEALRGLRSKAPERERPDDKPSVLEQIRTAREAPCVPKDRAARQNKKDKGGTEL